MTNHNRQLQELFDGFALLTPSKQSAFLSALFYEYGLETVRDRMALTFTDGETAPDNLLVSLFQLYFTHYLPDDMIPVVQDLLHAMEYYVMVCATSSSRPSRVMHSSSRVVSKGWSS